jgi:AcrR family transcriptional regulator
MSTVVYLEEPKHVTAKRKPASATPPKGRDRQRTRSEILATACRSFATVGYARSSMRDIAAAAGITPALVVRYFGGKQKLFVAAIERDLLLEPFLAGDRQELGRKLADGLMSKGPHETDALASLLLGATDPSLSAIVKRIVHKRLFGPLAEWLGGRDAESRAALFLAVVSGAWMYRQLLPLPPLAGAVAEPTRARLAAMLQELLDAPPAATSGRRRKD